MQGARGPRVPDRPVRAACRSPSRPSSRSWNNDRAIVYRRTEKIPDDIGTAVNVQSMVYGNAGDDCGTGVAFTRDPSTGERAMFGEYLMNAQGEDVVAGVRTPVPISELPKQNPAIYQEFIEICDRLEDHYKDMQDIEFTIEHNRLFMLQCRSRQAHRSCRGQDRGGNGERGADHARRRRSTA